MDRDERLRFLAERIQEDWAWRVVGGYCETDGKTYCKHRPVKVPAALDQPEYAFRLYYWAHTRSWFGKWSGPGAPCFRLGEEVHEAMTDGNNAEEAAAEVFRLIYLAEGGEEGDDDGA